MVCRKAGLMFDCSERTLQRVEPIEKPEINVVLMRVLEAIDFPSLMACLLRGLSLVENMENDQQSHAIINHACHQSRTNDVRLSSNSEESTCACAIVSGPKERPIANSLKFLLSNSKIQKLVIETRDSFSLTQNILASFVSMCLALA